MLLVGIGISSLVANSVILYITFLFAYFSNNYVFSININNYGEAYIELIIIPVSLLLGIYAVVNLFKQIKPEKTKI